MILYTIYRSINASSSNKKYNPYLFSKKPYNNENNYEPDMLSEKISAIDFPAIKQNLSKVQKEISKIILESSEENKKQYHRILRKRNPIFKNKHLYQFDDINNEVDLFSELYDDKDYRILLNDKFESLKSMDYEVKPLNGKILVFLTGLTTHDGAPISESKGFVDTYDIPPMDTWFYLTSGHLFCWIPEEYIDIMQSAIDVEIFGSYLWLEDEDKILNNRIISK